MAAAQALAAPAGGGGGAAAGGGADAGGGAAIGKAPAPAPASSGKAVGKCNCTVDVARAILYNTVSLAVGAAALTVGVLYREAKCETEVAPAAMALGGTVALMALFTQADDMHRHPWCGPAARERKGVTRVVVHSAARLLRGAAVAVVAWLAYEAFRNHMWQRVMAPAALEPAPCDTTLYSYVAIGELAILGILALRLSLFLVAGCCAACCLPAPKAPIESAAAPPAEPSILQSFVRFHGYAGEGAPLLGSKTS